MRTASFFAVSLGITAVSAHGYVSEIVAGGQSYAGYNPTIAPWVPDQDTIAWPNWATDTGFVSAWDLQNTDIICHRNSSNARKSAAVTAGSDISLTWISWAESHHGPIVDYVAECGGDCAAVDMATLKWIKIAEMGQLELGAGGGTAGYWAADTLWETDLTWKVTIPASLKPGNYVLRHEIIALHSAYAEGDAQFYPQCINLEVSGNGQDSPEGVLGTDLYKSTDPGVLYDIYNDQTGPTYVIPGPPLYTS